MRIPTLYALMLSALLMLLSINLSAQDQIENLLIQSHETYFENPAESFYLCEEAETIASETGDHSRDGDISMCKARYLILVTKYAEAGEEINKAISIFQGRNDLYNLASAYSLKALLFDKIGEEKSSHYLAVKIIDIRREIGDTSGLVHSLTNMCLDYKAYGDLDSMLLCLSELESLQKSMEPEDFYFYYQNWGMYHQMRKEYGEARSYFVKALSVSEELNMTDSRATVLVLLSQIHRVQGEWDLAKEYSRESYDFSMDNDLIYETADALKELILVMEESGNYKEGYMLQHKLIEIEKEIYSLEKIGKIKEMEGKLALAEKETEIAEKESSLQAEKLKNEEQRSRNTWLMMIVGFIILVLGFTVFIYLKTRKLNHTIQAQKEVVEHKSQHLEAALDDIQSSLEYGKLIQSSMLPPEELFARSFREHFVLYRPKDVVSGDFYWIQRVGEVLYFAVGDCTGHGIPGALVNVVCNEALNKVVLDGTGKSTGQILDAVREIVVQTFGKNSASISDGMDIALCARKGDKLYYSGAHNPLWIVRGDELLETKADKQPVGKYHLYEPFTTHEIKLEPGDTIYLFSDGYADQFGGDKMKKFKTTNFKKLILSTRHQMLAGQHQHINTFFDEWKGSLEQLDDVCVLGLRI